LASEVRQICAGMPSRSFYEPEALGGPPKVVVVVKPRGRPQGWRGVESNGMIVAGPAVGPEGKPVPCRVSRKTWEVRARLK